MASADSYLEKAGPEVPAGLPGWITLELIEETMRVWQPYCTEPLTTSDACEILLNVAQLFDVLEFTDG